MSFSLSIHILIYIIEQLILSIMTTIAYFVVVSTSKLTDTFGSARGHSPLRSISHSQTIIMTSPKIQQPLHNYHVIYTCCLSLLLTIMQF